MIIYVLLSFILSIIGSYIVFILPKSNKYISILYGIMLHSAIFSMLIPSINTKNSLLIYILSFTLMFTLNGNSIIGYAVHNIPEGMSMQFSKSLSLSIALQNIPESITISLLLKHKGYSKYKVLLLSIFISLFEVLGYYISLLLKETYLLPMMLFTSGIIIYEVLNEKDEINIIYLILGFTLMCLFN